MEKKYFQIAIDGPVAAGKGTIASILAQKKQCVYVDTGAMYRAAALLAKRNNIDLLDEGKLTALLKKTKLTLAPPKKNDKNKCLVFLNGEEVTKDLRTPEISWGSSKVATLPQVRKILVEIQKKIAKKESVIMEGRDITTRVLPEADFKIYLTASQEERARRRKMQLEEQGINKSFSEVLAETKKRDDQDTKREADPLRVAPDAWVLDTTNLTIDQVVEAILQRIKANGNKKNYS